MPRSRLPDCSIVVLAVAASGACAGTSRPDPLAAPGAQLARVEELAPASGVGGAAPFAGACAARLRDPATGREYLLVHSSMRTATAATGATSTTTLQAAIGDYALVDGLAKGAPVPRVQVDCPTSRVIAQLAPES